MRFNRSGIFSRARAAGCLAVVLALAACGGSREAAEDEILIAAIFDLTGPTADVGLDYADAVRGHVEWLNARGGIRGRPVRLIYQDYGYQVDRAEQLYTQFVQEGALIFMGWGTGDTEALRLKITEDRVPFASASLSHVLGNAEESPYNFLVATSYSDQFRIVLRWIAADHRAKGGQENAQVAFMHSASPFGRSPWVQGGEDYASEIGVDVRPYEMPRGATDYTAEFSRISQSGATYVVFQNTSAPAAVALRNARGLGVDATFVCLNWCANALLMRLAEGAADGVIGAIPWTPLTDDVPGVRDIRAYLESRGEDYSEKTNAYTQGWWTLSVFVEGIRRVIDSGQELTGENIKRALETIEGLDTGGAGPPLTFTPSDHRGSKGLRLFRAEDGVWSPVTEVLTAPS
ncbi:ABC transporter substrate-binding protein [Candidatus Palauibacter sp.]|uniref:ABC transporter substrate-binding protein n=1 Tax=Candidatus Palauibacter sp. TaxID=3101350 RepID=UPI003AF233F2